ncbi:hypothetical protein [Vagococcus zengguangii]|uniref:Uncharacterized protein n=1 Tax=Vagococcus zengguangii TaxID=2571750 RepID=A0A4D7CRP7_9ENTE|nr:hypothetical protein [Vagococcus zengguangii]QCI86845.1 hypothetical protein FA707_07650 [Vagococcus zengguangii]TLG80451.1 hypothetical protein FE258_05275 [Vagococcus zengguangii]
MNEWQIDSLASLDGSVSAFKDFVTSQAIYEIDGYFILEYPRIERLFQQSITQLADTAHITPDFLIENQASVIAMTIDGDFIIANDQHTWVLERSLYKEDCECFTLPINLWWQAYFDGEIISRILAL